MVQHAIQNLSVILFFIAGLPAKRNLMPCPTAYPSVRHKPRDLCARLLGCALLAGLAMPARAGVLLSENFDAAQPGAAYAGTVSNSAFSAIAGNVDVIGTILNGARRGYFTCPAGGSNVNNCLDLNGDIPGTIQSNASYNLRAGVTYSLAFDLAGSSPNPGNTPYSLAVSLGSSPTRTYSAVANSAFARQAFSFTPTTDETAARLMFASTSLQTPSYYGPLLDNVVLTEGVVVTASMLRPAQVNGDVLFSENFNGARPSGNYSGAVVGTKFTTSTGTTDIFGDITNGAPAAFFSCPTPNASGNNCLDLNGDQPGAITATSPLYLLAGLRYRVSLDIAGNVPDGSSAPYMLGVTLGDSSLQRFTADPGSNFRNISFDYTPTADQPSAGFTISSEGVRASNIYGAVIDNVAVTVDLPEPGVLSLLLVGGGGLWRLRQRRAKS
jgi:hypothetical protein